MAKPPTRSKRFLKLAGMTASAAGTFARSRAKSLFLGEEAAEAERQRANKEAGELIAETLGELKGAVMKVGQMASVASDLLPRELSDALSRLQKQAPPMPYSVIAEQVEAELGASPDQLFQRFDPEPFAAASIGQVHRATTDDGREVVVKVQYPGVDGAVDTDLLQLKLALRASGIVKVSKEAMDETFTELKARLLEELDYCNEADNVRTFQQLHAEDDYLVIPEVVGERSSARVLTLTYEAGDHLDQLGERGYSQADRDHLGHRLLEMLCSQIFVHGTIHADPHPGNFAVRPDGRIVMYDFGCVKVLPPAIVQAYRELIQAGIDEDYHALDRALIELGARKAEVPPLPADFYHPWREIFARPLLSETPYDYSQATFQEDLLKLTPKFLKKMNAFTPAKDLVFLDRTVAGHYGNLKTLRARVPTFKILIPFMEPGEKAKN